MTSIQQANVPVTVIDRPSRDGDHLFVAEHASRQVVGAVGADWQRDPARRARAGMCAGWESEGVAESLGGVVPRCTGSVAITHQLVQVEGVEFFEAEGRPAFVVPATVRFAVEDHHGDDAAVERMRGWYQAAWSVLAMSQFISEIAALREAMLHTGQEKTTDFCEVEGELSQARLSISKAKAVLASVA